MEKTTEDAISTEESAESTVTTEETQISVEDFNSLKKQLEDIKAAQQGSDRKVTEKEKQLSQIKLELEEERKSKMSADEKLDYERQLSEERNKQTESKLLELERKVLVKDFLINKNLDVSWEKYLTGNTVEELETQSGEMLASIEAEVEKRIKEKFKTSTPQKGDSPETNKSNIDDMIKTAQEAGDFVKVLSLKELKRQAV